VEGLGFADVGSPYDGLPGRAEGVVRNAVWDLSRDSSGVLVRFASPPRQLLPWRRADSTCTRRPMPAAGTGWESDGRRSFPKTRMCWLAHCQPVGANMTHVAQLGRMLDREVINLGFSGDGQMEPEVTKFGQSWTLPSSSSIAFPT